MADDAIQAGTVEVPVAQGGRPIEAYAAAPLRGSARGSVVVIHHAPGYDDATKEIVRRLASEGFNAICPNLYSREAPPGMDAKEAAKQVRAAGGVPDDQVIGDVTSSVQYLRSQESANGRVGVIGYCTGGRQAVLAACRTDLQAAVDCYGAYVTRSTPEDDQLPRASIADELANLGCPLLGLFGADDPAPALEEVAELESLLEELGKEHEIRIYDGAGHAFFSVDSPKYRTAAALDGWQQVLGWFRRHLSDSSQAVAP